MGLYLPPSYEGYAHGPDESAYPELWDGLVGLWLPGMRGRNGTDGVKDFSGKGNHGTTNGSMTASDWVAAKKPNGQVGHALDFDGTDDYVDLGTTEPLVSLQTPMTITAWVKADGFTSPNNRAIVGQYASTSNHQLIKLLRFDSGVLRYFASTSSGGFQFDSYSGTFSTDTWYFIHAVISGDTSSPSLRLGADGDEESFSMSALSTTPDTSVGLYIGSDEFGDEWNGQLDDIRIYNRALSSNEIRAIYYGASPLTPKRPFVGKAAAVGGTTRRYSLPIIGVG